MPFLSTDQPGGYTSNSLTHKNLRQILGAFRTSSNDSQYAEAREAPLQLRYEKLAL